MRKYYYIIRYDNPSAVHIAQNAYSAFMDAMKQFASNPETNFVTIWKCKGGDIMGTLYKAYSREDFNNLKALKLSAMKYEEVSIVPL